MAGEFFRFGIVGTLGFLVDWGTLELMLMLGTGPYMGRVVSYVTAATSTFALNRAWTFRSRNAITTGKRSLGVQWGRFLTVNLVGFAANYGTYAALVASVALVEQHPVLGVAAGSLAGMFLNFGLSRRFVFSAT
jgi:putative flippase GtrA